MEKNNRRMVSFNFRGPLRGYYCDLEVRPYENYGHVSAEMIIRSWARQHFPMDWCTTYDPQEFQSQIAQFNLRLLCKGRIEGFDGKNFFHESPEGGSDAAVQDNH